MKAFKRILTCLLAGAMLVGVGGFAACDRTVSLHGLARVNARNRHRACRHRARRLLGIYDGYGSRLRILPLRVVQPLDLVLQNAHFAFELRHLAQKLKPLTRFGLLRRLILRGSLRLLRGAGLCSRGLRRSLLFVIFQRALHVAENVIHVLLEQKAAMGAADLAVVRLLSAIFTDLHSTSPFCLIL